MKTIEINDRLSKNIQFYRKQKKMTQLELADYLQYSDKAISKWERAEGVPDIYVLSQLADLFEITLDDLVYQKPRIIVPQSVRTKKHLTITLAALVSVWIVAITLFSLLLMLDIHMFNLWYIFIIAIPISAIVLIVFSSIWANGFYIISSISLFLWTLALMLTILVPTEESYLFFIMAIPIQVGITLVAYSIKYSKKQN